MLKSKNGYFGEYGGRFIPEILHETFQQLEEEYQKARKDPKFWEEYKEILATYSCRPTPITYAKNLSEELGGARIYLKREDLNQTGAHKLNNVIGQGLLTQRMGKSRVIAETGAGQHGVATATMAAKFGFEATIYMGAVDVARQYPNVFWMEKLGAKVVPVETGTRILKDAINEALRDWADSFEDTHYVLGTACGPDPFPEMVMWFQSIIGTEAREQILRVEDKLPTTVYACVGGGSNATGIFSGFLEDDGVRLIGVEAGGHGVETEQHAARLASEDASVGVAQGYKTYFLQNSDGQFRETHSISAGLDYVGVSPILSDLSDSGRVEFEAATDEEVVEAFRLLVSKEGIIPALESTHAVAQAIKDAPNYSKEEVILVSLSGRGDKDIFTIADGLGDKKWREFLVNRAGEYSDK